jgi:hypothetical protein
MENLTTPLTRTVMEYALDSLHTTPVNWSEPAGIQHLPGYVIRSHVGFGSIEPSPSTEIYPSWYKQRATSSKAITIDKVSGKVATSCTPDLAKQNLGGNSAPNAFSIDVFYPPGNNASASNLSSNGPQDDVHHCGDAAPTISITADDNCDTSCSISATAFAGAHPLNDSAYPQYPGTITIAVNGNTICTSSSVSDGVPISCGSYSPTFNGSGTITATITDSVLYSGTDSKTVNFTQGAGALTFTNITANDASWSGGSGTYTITRVDNGDVLCSTTSNSCSFSGPSIHNKQIRLSDSSGDPPVNGVTP